MYWVPYVLAPRGMLIACCDFASFHFISNNNFIVVLLPCDVFRVVRYNELNFFCIFVFAILSNFIRVSCFCFLLASC